MRAVAGSLWANTLSSQQNRGGTPPNGKRVGLVSTLAGSFVSTREEQLKRLLHRKVAGMGRPAEPGLHHRTAMPLGRFLVEGALCGSIN